MAGLGMAQQIVPMRGVGYRLVAKEDGNEA